MRTAFHLLPTACFQPPIPPVWLEVPHERLPTGCADAAPRRNPLAQWLDHLVAGDTSGSSSSHPVDPKEGWKQRITCEQQSIVRNSMRSTALRNICCDDRWSDSSNTLLHGSFATAYDDGAPVNRQLGRPWESAWRSIPSDRAIGIAVGSPANPKSKGVGGKIALTRQKHILSHIRGPLFKNWARPSTEI